MRMMDNNSEVGISIRKLKLPSGNKAKKAVNPKWVTGKKMFHDKQKEAFYMELHAMLDAGMDIKSALDIFYRQNKDGKLGVVYDEIRNNVVSGDSLFGAMQKSGQFSPYEFYCVQIGEESGKMQRVLGELSLYFGNKVKLKRQLIKSLSYPLVILLSSIGAVSFMVAFIIPMFTDIFKRFNGELPLLTRFFISISRLFIDHAFFLFCFLIVLLVVLRALMRNIRFVQYVQLCVPKIPFIGRMISGIYFARFCSSMALLISAKVPIVNALQLVVKMIDYYPIQSGLRDVENDIINGKSFHESLARYNLFDEKAISMIRIGEEINGLDVFFEKLHQRYSDEVEMLSSGLNTFLEPLIVVLLGGIVGLILIAMYLPMFKLSTSMGI